GEGMIRAMREALAAAGREPGDVGYVNAHGTGTLQNDRVEALAMARVFGEGRVLVSSTKSLVGHTMAAAGSVEAAATLLSLQHGLIPPTANLLDPDSVRRLSRICRMTLAACRTAVQEAGLGGGTRLGLVVGSEHGDFRSGGEFVDGFLRRGPAGLSPLTFPSTVMNSMAAVAGI